MFKRELLLQPRPAEVDEQRRFLEHAFERARQRRRQLPIEISTIVVPHDVAVGERNEQLVAATETEPVLDLTWDPLRLRRPRRGQQEEVLGIAKGRLDGRPQFGRRRQASAVEKHPHRAKLIPRARKAVEARLQNRRKPIVSSVAVRDKDLVGHWIAASAVREGAYSIRTHS